MKSVGGGGGGGEGENGDQFSGSRMVPLKELIHGLLDNGGNCVQDRRCDDGMLRYLGEYILHRAAIDKVRQEMWNGRMGLCSNVTSFQL